MFTGIVEGVGSVVSVQDRGKGRRLSIAPPPGQAHFQPGESVCVSGVCLTAIAAGRRLVADLSAETLRRSTLGGLSEGDPVNLERALRWGDALSGHFVMGHVDGISRVLAVDAAADSWTFRFSIPRALSRLVAVKGSVALDGVSLTVAARNATGFTVAVIPESLRRTTLGGMARGARVNFEADIFARYGRAGSLRRIRRAGPRG